MTTLKALRPVPFLHSGHYALFTQLCLKCWDGTKSAEIAKRIHAKELAVFEVGKGLVLLEPLNHPRGRELFIYGIVGTGILRESESIVEDLKALAQEWGCTMIGADGVPEGWSRVAKALGFQKMSTRYMKELTNGG